MADDEYGEIDIDWENPPSLMDIKADLQEATIHHGVKAERISRWLDTLRNEGHAKPKTRKNRSRIAPKTVRKNAEWRYSSLTEPFIATKDLFNASPVTWEDTKAAKQNELVLNHQFNTRIDRSYFIDEYVRTAVDEGTVIVKVGWEYEDEEVEEEQPVVELILNPEFAPILEEIAKLKQSDPNGYETRVPYELQYALDASIQDKTAYQPQVVGTEMVKRQKIIKNQPTVEVCDYRNVYIDSTCLGNISKAKHVIHSFESDKATLKKDGRYSNIDNLVIDTNSSLNESNYHRTSDDSASGFNFRDEGRRTLIVNEYWGELDIDNSGTLTPVLLAWVNNTFVRAELNPYPDQQHPFVNAMYMPVKRSIYGEPDAELLDEHQQIIGAVTRGVIDTLGRSANAQTGMQMSMLDPVNKRLYKKGEDYEFAPNVNPQTGIYVHTYPEISNSAQFVLQQQNAEAESLTGVKAFYSGLNSDSLGDVAASVKGVLDSSARRELGILRRLANGVVKIGRKIASMNGEFLSDTEIVRITNEEFVPVRRDELAGEFDLQLTISSAEEDNVKAQELAFMVQTIGPNIDMSLTQMMLSDIFRLRKMPELAKKIAEFQPQPDPFEEQMKQLQLAEMQGKIALLQSQAMENQAEAQLDQAKVGTEQAKAQDLQATTDRKALDFVQEESGVNQERALETAQAQAQGNIALEGVKQGFAQQRADQDKQHDTGTKLLEAYLQEAAKSDTPNFR